MPDLAAISNFDNCFYYGLGDLLTEIESELTAGLIQEKRSLFYNRKDAAGLKENYPNAFTMSIATKYDIVNWIGYRNGRVSDGTNGNPDRRVAVSQDYISFSRDSSGNLDVQVLYIPFFSFKKAQQLSIPVSGGLS